MRPLLSTLSIAALMLPAAACAISAKHAEQLEKSGCTQVADAQGCAIRTSRAENAKTRGMIVAG